MSTRGSGRRGSKIKSSGTKGTANQTKEQADLENRPKTRKTKSSSTVPVNALLTSLDNDERSLNFTQTNANANLSTNPNMQTSGHYLNSGRLTTNQYFRHYKRIINLLILFYFCIFH